MAIVTTPRTSSTFSWQGFVASCRRCFPQGLLAPAWVAAMAIGFYLLLDYKHIPGEAAVPPANWPAEAVIPAPAGRPTLLVFSHPHCPCTRATFRELERILALIPFRIDVRVIFVGIADSPNLAESISLLSAAQLPLAEIDVDAGDLARLFRVKTSGHVLYYNAHGELRFSGGVTASRGHEGDSPGGSALTSWIRTGAGDRSTAPVFGCPLFASQAIAKCDLPACGGAAIGE